MLPKMLYIKVILFIVIHFISIDLTANVCDSIMNILQDHAVSYQRKIEMADDISHLLSKDQIVLYSFMIKESEQKKDQVNLVRLNSYLAHAFLFSGQYDSCFFHLKKVSSYTEKIDNTEILGIFNRVFGDYYNVQHDYEKAHEYYYKAIDYFQESNTMHNRKRTIPIFHNIAFPYIQEGDILSLKVVLDRMYQEVKAVNDDYSESIYYGLLSYYYGCKYGQQQITADLDSAIICDEKIIRIYQTQEGEKSLYPDEMAYRYINLANNKLKKENPDYIEINDLAREAYDLSNPIDTAMLVNCLWVEGYSLFKMKEIRSAEQKFLELEVLMDNWGVSTNLDRYSHLCEFLSQIYLSYGDYEKALIYEKKKGECNQNIYNTDKFKAIKELQTKYETEKKEQQIRNQKKINIFIASIALLLALTSFFIINWQIANRKLLRAQLKTIEQEKVIIEKRLGEQDNQLKEAKAKEQKISEEIREKEQLFNDTKLKGLSDLIEARQQIQILSIQQKELQNIISNVETNISIRESEHKEMITLLQDTISKKIKDPRRDNMLDIISQIDDKGILLLKEKSLTTLQIEYSILIAIGLNPKDLAFVFSVAYQTARTHRSKLREALGIESPDNLDAYLVRLLLPSDKSFK